MSEPSVPDFAPLPEWIGAYRVLSLLGEGGMGRVYLAEQREPHRTVALKVLRAASLSAESGQRFRREVAMLASLEHPGIARLYAAGVAQTEAGALPYMAMEYVRGVDLRQYALSAGPGLRDRLALVAAIARAVHFAHTRGVIHRDLKPSNILVQTGEPETGRPKILDFGVAHATAAGAEQMTLAGQVLGTLPYMSPEQLGGGAAQADPRSDVYSLGVIAYELIAGTLPFPGLVNATVIEALGTIRTETPRPLSRLVPEGRGDVETLVAKAMAFEPAQRYGSAAEFAADIERYLAHQPIEARPPSATYLLGLLMRRHRALSAGLGVAALALLAATVISLSFALAEARARKQADARAAETVAVNQFLEKMLTSSSPEFNRGREVSVREVLDDARINLLADRSLSPGVRAVASNAVGASYRQLGDYATALLVLDDAEKTLPPGSDEDQVLREALSLTRVDTLIYAGRSQEALAILAPLVAIEVPRSVPAQRLWIDARGKRVAALAGAGRNSDALAAADAVVRDSTRLFGEADPATLAQRNQQIDVLYRLGSSQDALTQLDALLPALVKAYGEDHPSVLEMRNLRALTLSALGRPQDAEAEARAVLAARARVLGEGHVLTAQTRFLLSDILYGENPKSVEAETLMRGVLETYRKVLGPDRPRTLLAMNTIAVRLEDAGKPAEAEAMYHEIFAANALGHLADSNETLPAYSNYAFLLMNTGRLSEAERAFSDLVPRAVAALGPGNVLTVAFESNLAECLLRMKRPAEARAILEQTLIKVRAPDGIGLKHPRAAKIVERLARADEALGFPEKAAETRALLPPSS